MAQLECLSEGLGLICEFHGFIWQDGRKMWVRIVMTLPQGDWSEQVWLSNLPEFFLKWTRMGSDHRSPLVLHWLNSLRSWTKDTFDFSWVTWAKYNSMMNLSFDSFTLILFCHLLGKSKWETVGQFIITYLSIQSLNIKQWVQEGAGVYQAASGSDLPTNITYSWVCYTIEFSPSVAS